MALKEKTKTKRQLAAETRQAALAGQWTEALELNNHLITRFPRDVEAHNRRGRALLELDRYTQAVEAYSEALRLDPANMIARGNLQRLEHLRHKFDTEPSDEEGTSTTTIPRTLVFIEEVGKTWVDELVNPAGMDVLADVSSGLQLELEPDGQRLYVARPDTGQRLGEVEARTGQRVIELMEGGNRYEVYALGLSAQSLRVILREVYREQSQAGKIAFPRQIRTMRDLLREREILFQRDEADFLLLEDDDGDDDTGEENGDDTDNGDQEPDTFADESITVDEDGLPR